MSTENLTNEQIWEAAMGKAQAGEPETNSNVLTDDDFEVVGGSTEDADINLSDDTQEGSTDNKEGATQTSDNKKTFKIKDEFGEDRDLTVELTDDNLQQLLQKAKNAELIEQEKTALADELQSIKDQMTKMKETFEEVNSMKSLSPEELIDKMYAKDGGYSAWLKKQHDEIERGKEMTEDELKEYKQNKEKQAWDKEKKALAEKVDNLMKQIQGKNEEAEQRTLDSWVESATSKYSFGHIFKDNEQKAQKWDARVWSEAQRNLKQIQDQGVNLTPAIINREVQKSFLDFKADIEQEAKVKADATIESQKDKAAVAATNNFKTTAETDALELKVRKLLEANDETKIRQLISQAPVKMKAILQKIASKR